MARRDIRRRWAAWLALWALLPVACSTTPAGQPAPPPIEGYIVGAPDELRIHILPAPEILREVRVRPDGKISVDLVGDIQAAGKTPFEIAGAIQKEIVRYKRDAAVNVAVLSSPSQFVTVLGEVVTPGTFALETETRVSEAIGRRGGPRPFASLNNVRVIRAMGQGSEIYDINLGDIQKGNLSTNIVVEEGDLIVVPPTFLAKIGYAFQMLLFPLQPILSGAATIGAAASGVSVVQ